MLRSWLMKALYRFYRPSPYSHEYHLAAQAAADLSCRSVVDIGCGWGNLAAFLRPGLYIGVDLFPGFRGSGEEHFVVGAGGAAPLRPGAADCAFYVNSVFYICSRDRQCISEVVSEALEVARCAVIVDLDPRYPHTALLNAAEGWLRPAPEAIEESTPPGARVVKKAKKGATYMVAICRDSGVTP